MMVIPAFLYQKTEDWSFTFYEGLNRHPDSISKDKTVSELVVEMVGYRLPHLTSGLLSRRQLASLVRWPCSYRGPTTIRYAMKKLLGLRKQKDGSLLEAVAEQKRVLGNRSWCLEERPAMVFRRTQVTPIALWLGSFKFAVSSVRCRDIKVILRYFDIALVIKFV
ncbi:hypothetical protein VitviT2T_029309 [Vitis vinifera]|uniref:Uncharacterized protein n=1 Tax=Vitis vinifera TaxID=29760 RepID=A0ABY9DVS0_VITVI|nr:hypothetical protein VitviT2T_029309 [Vitis vinifera]